MTHEIIEQYLRNRTKQDGDHILWTGNVDEYSRPKCLRISELKEQHCPHVWSFIIHNGRQLAEGEKLKRICTEKTCISPHHWILTSKQQDQMTENDYIIMEQYILNNSEPNEEGCRIWIKHKFDAGYGCASFKGKNYYAHRLALMAKLRRLLAAKEMARHMCKNKGCVKFDHLEPGDASDNANDTIRDGTCKTAKITKEIAAEIWEMRETHTEKEIAEQYEVSLSIVQGINKGLTWRSVTGLPKPTKSGIDKEQKAPNKEQCNSGLEKIESKCKKLVDDQGEHWIWPNKSKVGTITPISIAGTTKYAHVQSWICANQQLVPEEMVVRHICKQKLCVNPLHLEIGTRKENAADMRRDGTVKSVINLDMAKQIKSLKDTKPPSAIAKELGVSVHIVRDIWKGKSWQYA